MSQSEIIAVMEKISTILNDLISVSEKQQILLGTGELEALPETFEQRRGLFDKLVQCNEKLIELEKNQVSNLEPKVEIYRQQIVERKDRFLSYDQRVSILLIHHQEKIGYALFQRLRAKEVVKDYKETERITSLVARLFEGNTRHLDVKK